MKKYTFLALLIIFTVLAGFQMAAPVSAVKWSQFDKKVIYNPGLEPGNTKIVFLAYKKGNNKVMVKRKVYVKDPGSTKFTYRYAWTDYLIKISKNKLLFKDWWDLDEIYGKKIYKTKYSAVKFYYKYYIKRHIYSLKPK